MLANLKLKLNSMSKRQIVHANMNESIPVSVMHVVNLVLRITQLMAFQSVYALSGGMHKNPHFRNKWKIYTLLTCSYVGNESQTANLTLHRIFRLQ
jgi:hypothetical protein